MFVIRNIDQHYLAKNRNWVDGRIRKLLFRTLHKDAAVNELFEAILRDPTLRGEVLEADRDNRDQPSVEVLNPIAALAESKSAAEPELASTQEERTELAEG